MGERTKKKEWVLEEGGNEIEDSGDDRVHRNVGMQITEKIATLWMVGSSRVVQESTFSKKSD